MSKPLPSILALLLLTLSAGAKVEIFLPLGGYYRPGKYMPVRMRASGEPKRFYNLILRGDGAMTTIAKAPNQVVDTVVPLLVLNDRLRSLTWSLDWTPPAGSLDLSLIPLSPDQKLVGFDRPDLDFALKIFPGASIVPLRLDEVGTMTPDAQLAWHTFDLLVLDHPRDITPMVLNGVNVAVRSTQRPDDKWPWHRMGEYWLYRPPTRGPQTAGLNPQAFAPVQGWQAQLPAPIRRRILIFAVIFAIILLAATLAPRRLRTPLAVFVALLASALFIRWGRTLESVQSRSAAVLVELDRPVAHLDWWVYTSARKPALASHACRGMVLPFWEHLSDFEKLDPELFCDSNGKLMSLMYKLQPGVRLAVMDRQEDATGALASDTKPSADLTRLLDRIYRKPGDTISHLPSASHPNLPYSSLGSAKITPHPSAPTSLPSTQGAP